MSDGPDRPAGTDGAPEPRPSDTARSGRAGETAWEAQGSVLGRLKQPVSSGGRGTASGVVTTDRDVVAGTDAGASHVGGAGTGAVEPHGVHGVDDLDLRRERRAEYAVAFWFSLSALATFAFVVTDLIGNTHKQYYTPLLGVFMAVALGGLGAGMIHWAKRLMGDEEAVQEREPHNTPVAELEATERVFARGFETTGLARRPIVRRTLLLAAGALGLLGVVPILNLGPMSGRRPKALGETSWRLTQNTTDATGKPVKGIRMIDQFGRPIKLGDIAAGGLLTVFPALDPDKDRPGFFQAPSLQVKGDSTTLLIRLRPGELIGRNAKDTYFDHIAFSKICTHAGCPVSLYEQQTHHLLCPCHQSIFVVTDRARPISGPAARPLPQLAITVDNDGYFIAKGDFNQPVGPTFWERG